MNHALKFGTTEVVVCQPIPLEASSHIADHIQVNIINININKDSNKDIFCLRIENNFRCNCYRTISYNKIICMLSKESSILITQLHLIYMQVILAGFAEQGKTSVVHMRYLFHAFILCRLWTVYLEQTITMAPPDEAQILAGSILLELWRKVTPGVNFEIQ